MTPQITSLKVNGIENPLGFDTETLSFSWVVSGTKAKHQKSAQVLIAEDESFKNLIHDSNTNSNSNSVNSIDYNPNLSNLKARTRYYWKVIVVTDLDEKIESPVAFYETSKLNEEWLAKWISTEKVGKTVPPYVRKSFELENKKIVKARAYVTGFGLYELFVNGKKPTDEYFTPFNNNYKLWLQYQTFDVTSHLQSGTKNVIGCQLGDGWARGRFGFDQPSADFTRKTDYRGNPTDYASDRYELLLELHIIYEDGSENVVVTDNSWKCHKSDVLLNNIYDGEIQDANLKIDGWCTSSCDDSKWESCVEIVEPLHEKLTPRFSPPVVVKERLQPKEIIKTPAGETVIDMGQNMTGWLEIKISAPKGFEVILEHGEILQEGNFFRENIRTALEQFRYISNGEPAVISPHFTYYGFRYVRLTQWHTDNVDISDFIGCNVYSDLELTGKLETGIDLVNKLIANGLWSQKDNFLDVPTDCPQRDERLGWTGDAQIFCTTAMFNMNCYAFYRKYLKDIYLHQLRDNGIPPLWAPTWLDTKSNPFPAVGMIGWSDAATVMPWNIYVMNGKKQILLDQFKSMKAWVDVMAEHIVDGLWNITYLQLCDWLALDGPESKLFNKDRIFGGTETTFCCTVYYYISLTLTYKAAQVIGDTEAYNKYYKLAQNTLQAIRHEYFTPSGRCAIQTQTALSLVIMHDLAPEGGMKYAVAGLHKLLENRDFHLSTGFLGTPILCRALTKGGVTQDAYSTLLVEDYPGWLYPVTMGATSMWERWDSLKPDGKVSPEGMNSFNHYAYASICEWIYKDVCGINPVEEAPGFQKIVFRPHPDARLKHAKASYESPMGHIECGWSVSDKKVKYSFVVPFNVDAKIELLDLATNEVESANFEIHEEGNNIVSSLGAGEYEIIYAYKTHKYEMPNKFK